VFTPTIFDWSFLLGTFGLFGSLMYLFARFLPVIPAFEMRRMFREIWLGREG
jgi:molybdopterin-containing oxidoreductase family membrane subunit